MEQLFRSYRNLSLWLLAACFSMTAFAQSSVNTLTPGATQQDNVQLEKALIYMKINGFSAETVQGVQALSSFVAEKRAAGGVAPEESVFITLVQPVQANGAGLEQIVAGGNKLPKKSFFELTQQDKLTAGNYAKVVDALFDPSDMNLWLTNADGIAMNARELVDQKESLANSKSRWVNKYTDLINAGQQNIAEKWFLLFNTLVQKAIHGSREEFRRGLIAANNMASYPTKPQEKLQIYAPTSVTQAAELVLMIDPLAKLVQVERRFSPAGGEKYAVKYLMASGAQLRTIGFPEGEAASQLALKTWHANQETKFNSTKELGQIKGETAQIKGETAQIKVWNGFDEKFNALAGSLMKQLDEPSGTQRNAKFRSNFSRDFVEFTRVKKKLDALGLEDAEDKLVPRRGKETITLLYDTLVQTTRIKGIPLSEQ